MKHYFLINPAAGKGQHEQKLKEQILSAAKALGAEVEIYLTQGHGDATQYVREICGQVKEAIRFYACGGDGTFQEVINGMQDFSHAEATVIPCGSGNDFVRSFPVPDDFADITAQMNGVSASCDLLQVNDRFSVNLCNVGFDADICFDMEKFKHLPLLSGSAAYNLALVYNLLKRLGKKVTLQIDDQPMFETDILLAAAGNGRFYGGGYKATPYAALNDGIIDLCRVDKISLFRIAGFVSYYRRGEHPVTPALQKVVHYDKCRSLRITSKKPLRYVLDGESYLSDDVTIRILPNAFRLSLPRSCVEALTPPETVEA